MPQVEWFLGSKDNINVAMLKPASGAFVNGEKVWADPVIVDNVIYFSTFRGDIEDVEPLSDVVTPGYLYSRFILGAPALIGTTGFAGGETYLQLVSKTRSAVTKGEVRTVSEGLTKTDVWINEYDSTLEVVAQNGEIQGDKNVKLKIKSWREVYKIIR